MTLIRLTDWDRRLTGVTEKHIGLPMVWGESDCLLTVADAIEAITGKDFAEKIRGTYSDEQGAARAMRRRKCATVEDVLARRFPETGRFSAMRGDVGIVEIEGVITAGYVTEYGFAVRGESGLQFLPLTQIKRAFAIGER
ncbi:hypothetical protein [Ochrobactrum sp. SFR4]|uniref:DUF6950 family protein n=1 Tax=Ochrobactrum sp. SFR4 TaxID=2717368 RepID=UPI001C8CE810|nr:hypothetical protein [Ochrobactrum sp. SFR4]MBX8827265.1 hypothetical protein [Ochrobactrum sp. SFR4]